MALAALAALAGAVLWLYLRKRRQVADHYTMDEIQGGWEGGRLHGFESAETFRG
jgi:hypothetical protein